MTAASRQHNESTLQRNRLAGRTLLQATVIAAILAVVIDLIIYELAVAIWNVPGDFTGINAAMVIVVPIVAMIVAAIGLIIINRFSQRALSVFTVLAVVVTILSLSSPISAMSGGMSSAGTASHSTGATMIALHLITGAIIAFVLPSLLRRKIVAS